MDRMKELREVLLELAAQQIATHPTKDGEGRKNGRIDVYMVRGKLLLVQVYQFREGDSWELFVPLVVSCRIDDTITALKTWAQN